VPRWKCKYKHACIYRGVCLMRVRPPFYSISPPASAAKTFPPMNNKKLLLLFYAEIKPFARAVIKMEVVFLTASEKRCSLFCCVLYILLESKLTNFLAKLIFRHCSCKISPLAKKHVLQLFRRLISGFPLYKVALCKTYITE